jgi:hypothetical protein
MNARRIEGDRNGCSVAHGCFAIEAHDQERFEAGHRHVGENVGTEMFDHRHRPGERARSCGVGEAQMLRSHTNLDGAAPWGLKAQGELHPAQNLGDAII